MVAFLLGKLIDVSVFHKIRRMTGEKKAWLRATGSTAVSQLVDSFVALCIAFVLGPQKWSMELFYAIGTQNYVYKISVAIALIPLLYIARRLIHSYLGESQARQWRCRNLLRTSGQGPTYAQPP